jgi:hypothetical protein
MPSFAILRHLHDKFSKNRPMTDRKRHFTQNSLILENIPVESVNLKLQYSFKLNA